MENKNVDLFIDDNFFYDCENKINYYDLLYNNNPVTENPKVTIKLVQSISTDNQSSIVYRYRITKNVIKEIIKK